MQREAQVSNYTLAALTAASLVMLSLPLSGPVQAFKACLVYVMDPAVYYGAKGVDRLSGAPSRVRHLLEADIENRQLREEIQRAQLLRAEAEALRSENQRLRSALGLKAPVGRAPLWTRVLQRDPLHWYRSVVVDAGAEQGATMNAPVLGQGAEGLVAVGRVVEVRERTSVVLLVTDELSSVAAYLSLGTLEGLVQGQGGSRLRMNYLSPEASLEVGDTVYTSQTSATFPPDVLIGTVAKVYPRDPFLTFQSVEVRPAVDAASLKELILLKSRGTGPPPRAPEPEGPEEQEAESS